MQGTAHRPLKCYTVSMNTNMHMMPNLAQLMLTAVSLKEGSYTVLYENLCWTLTDPSNGNQQTSQDAQPIFTIQPGTFDLQITAGDMQKSINLITLSAGQIRDEVIFLGDMDAIEEEQNYQISHPDEFNPDSEYKRRDVERDGQRRYGIAADGLTQPPDSPEAGFGNELGHANAQHTGKQAHPLLAASAQFDGIDPKIKQLPNENPSAEVAPELAPGMALTQQNTHTSTPTMRPM